mgnify:FL=1
MAKSNVRVKEVELNLDKPRKLVYDMNAFISLEDIYGTIEEALKALDGKSIKAFRNFLWAGLVHEDDSLTVQKVGKLLSLDNLEEVSTKLAQAIQTSLPEVDREKAKN